MPSTDTTQHRLALPQGTRIRDFEFHRVLGHGGFGITYLGWNLALDIPVAIKEYLPTDLATREPNGAVVPQTSQSQSDFRWGLDRFLDEARILARFQHPHIVRIHQYFEAHRTAYIAMDYVEGETLSDLLKRKGRMVEDEVKAVLYPLLNALEVVHRADFLHRDIKPGNIVLRDKDGSPVLLDFGAARQAVGAKSRSVTSIVTPGYAPIEQYSTKGKQGPWTDIYALGGVCYRALTGHMPDDATERMRDDPLVLAAKRCHLGASKAFLSVIDWAMVVNEGDRPQSIEAWREAMEAETSPDKLAKDAIGADSKASARPAKDTHRTPVKSVEVPAFFRRSVVIFGLIALAVGSVAYVEHAAKQRTQEANWLLQQEWDAFVSAMGRHPHPSEKEGILGQTDLHLAVNLPVLTQFLITQGAVVNARNNIGATPLHVAAQEGASETAKVLLDNGAYLNARNNYGETPLGVAEYYGQSVIATILRQHGALK